MDFSHRFSLKFNPVCVVDEAVEDGIREGGVGNAEMPVSDRDLSGHQGGRAAIAVIEDLKQVPSLGAGQGVAEPVIEDKQPSAGQTAEQFGVGAIGLSQFKLLK